MRTYFDYYLGRKSRLLNGAMKVPRFYSGGFYYALAYTMFISFEFGIHDMMMEFIEDITGSKQVSLLNALIYKEHYNEEESESSEHESNSAHHHWHNEVVSALLAGSIAAFMTNGIELIAVNKQTHPSLTWKDILYSINHKTMTR